MLLTLKQLKNIIREVLTQDATVPGKPSGSGVNFSSSDEERLGNAGFLSPEDDEQDEENDDD